MGVINSLKNLFSAMRNLFSAIGKICNINFKKILLEKEQEMGKSKNNRKPNAPKLGNSSKSNSKEDSMLILSALENKLKREQMEPKQFVDLLINHLTSGGPCSTLNDDMFFYNVFGLLLNYMNIIDIMEKDIKYYNDKKQKNNCLNAETGSLIDNFIEKSESYIKNGSYCVLECYIAINAGNKPFQAFAHLFRMAYLSRFLVSHLKRNKSLKNFKTKLSMYNVEEIEIELYGCFDSESQKCIKTLETKDENLYNKIESINTRGYRRGLETIRKPQVVVYSPTVDN